MIPILNFEQLRELKVNEPLIECVAGTVNYYRFLCFHPRNDNYVILLNHCEEPVRFYYQYIMIGFIGIIHTGILLLIVLNIHRINLRS